MTIGTTPTDERLSRDELRSLFLFEALSDEQLDVLATHGWVNDCPAGDTILDLCAAPGGKTTYIAQLMRNEGRIIAQDTSADRLKLLDENCRRLGVTCVENTGPNVGAPITASPRRR